MAELQIDTPIAGPLAVDTPHTGTDGRARYRRIISLVLPTAQGAEAVSIDTEHTALRGTFRQRDFDARAAGQNFFTSVAAGAGGVIVELAARLVIRRIEVTGGVTGPVALHRLDGNTAADATLTRTLVNGGADFLDATTAEFFDLRFAVRATLGLTAPASVTLIAVRGYPTGARLGLMDPERPEQVDFFWQAPGEQRAPVAVDAAQPFATALAQWLGARAPSAPAGGPLALCLVIESDVPCDFEFQPGGLGAAHFPVVGSFTGELGKRVLRFSDPEGFRHELAVRLPAGAAVRRASVRVLPSFRGVHADPSDSAASGHLPELAEGVWVDDQRWVARSLAKPGRPVQAIALALNPIARDTTVQLELHDDTAGQPSGRVLARGEVAAGRAGQAGWVTWNLGQPVLLDATTWLVVTARRGAAVWLAANGEGVACVLDRDPAPGPFRVRTSLGGKDLQYRLFEPSGSNPAADTAPFALAIGERPVNTREAAGDAAGIVLDFTAALQAWLASDRVGITDVPLVFTGAASGLLTVYPPHIELD